ncbi:MAG: 50S ribosomal protein L3 [Desulfobacteraceae bacterium]|nr:MAG: 50S ribosomal protein L3 [Desulfobacteraceae bacterium]
MSKGLIGIKLGMTSIFTADGRFIPVTVIQAGPCVITQIKTQASDGYDALQLGFDNKKAAKTTKPLQGHFEKSGGSCFSHVREFEVQDPSQYTLGQSLGPDLFQVGDRVDVIGTSKGRGFAGVIKRHKFGGGRATHGGKCHRIPGSIGSSAWPSKVIKGKKLPGRYGTDRKTIRNLEIIDVRPEDNLLLVKGPVPGHKQALVMIKKLFFSKKV